MIAAKNLNTVINNFHEQTEVQTNHNIIRKPETTMFIKKKLCFE